MFQLLANENNTRVNDDKTYCGDQCKNLSTSTLASAYCNQKSPVV